MNAENLENLSITSILQDNSPLISPNNTAKVDNTLF